MNTKGLYGIQIVLTIVAVPTYNAYGSVILQLVLLSAKP